MNCNNLLKLKKRLKQFVGVKAFLLLGSRKHNFSIKKTEELWNYIFIRAFKKYQLLKVFSAPTH